MIIVDTGPLVALLNGADKNHINCRTFFERCRENLLVPSLVIAEVAYLAERHAGVEAEALFLESIAHGELEIEQTTRQDFQRMAELVRQYSDFPLGTVDAAVISIAERLGATQIATLDLRHFRAVRPKHCAALTIYPGD